MSTFGKSQSVYRLQSFLRYEYDEYQCLLQLEENDTLSVTGKVYDLDNPNVYFYVVTQWDLASNVLQYQFKPYSQSDKYIAIVDGQVALKTEDECTKSERTFYSRQENEDYQSFNVNIEDSSYYIACKKDGGLSVSSTKLDDESWFYMQPQTEEASITVAEADLIFERNVSIELVSEVAVAEE